MSCTHASKYYLTPSSIHEYADAELRLVVQLETGCRHEKRRKLSGLITLLKLLMLIIRIFSSWQGNWEDMPCIFTRGSSSRSISFNRSSLMSVRNILSFSACSSQSSASSSPSCVKMEKAYHQWQWFPICIHFDAVQFGAANLKKTKNTSSVTSRTLSFYSFLFKLLSVPNHNVL